MDTQLNIPERTLGWGVLNWCSTHLAQPDGETRGDRWVFTNEQVIFILHYYAVDENGKFTYRSGVLERPKGWGKSPLLAALCCAEMLGPVKFSHWDALGRPVGRPHPSPLIQIAGIAGDQARNTMTLVGEMLGQGDAKDMYNLDIAASRVVVSGQAHRRIETVTSSWRSKEGARVTFVVMDETHLWVPSEGGKDFYDVLVRNLVKYKGRWIETTNAFLPGEQSVAEMTHAKYESIQAGEAAYDDMYFDTRTVQVKDIHDIEELLPALRHVYGDAAETAGGWVALDDIVQLIQDQNSDEGKSRRFWLNEHVKGKSGWLNPELWKKIESRQIVKLRRSDKIAIGFKAKADSASIVGYRLTDGAIFCLGQWDKPHDIKDWELPYGEIDERMRKILDKFRVYHLNGDPAGAGKDLIYRWYVDYEEDTEVEEFIISNRKKMAAAIEEFELAVSDRRIHHPGDTRLTTHIMNCQVEEVRDGRIIRQKTRGGREYITAAQAAVLALDAGVLAIKNGALKDDSAPLLVGF